MKKAMALLLAAVCMLWASSAFAGYSALGDDQKNVFVGVGGLYLSGDDAAGDGQTEFIPTVNISGLADSWAWQAFYAFGDPATAFGGTLDYILASNFDECAECPEDGVWWFGVGPTFISYKNLFEDAAGANGIDCNCLGVNLGFGWLWDSWNFQLYAHYLFSEEVIALQANLNYAF